jgi:hypothetical protein
MSEMYAIVYNDDEYGYPVRGRAVAMGQDYYEDVEEDDELSLNVLMSDEIDTEDGFGLD